jgi:hypothetical protein
LIDAGIQLRESGFEHKELITYTLGVIFEKRLMATSKMGLMKCIASPWVVI